MRRSAINRVSKKQRVKLRDWAKVKKAMLAAQEAENFSYAACEKCGKGIPIERAADTLEAHHKQFRSHQGPNTEENCRILCSDCHTGPKGIHK